MPREKERLLIAIAVILFLVGLIVSIVHAVRGGEGDNEPCPDVLVQTEASLEQFKGQPWCRHNALFAAIIYGEYYPVRFQIGPIRCGGTHVQAQAYIDGEWKWLRLNRMNWPVVADEHDSFFTPERKMTIDDFIKEQKARWHWTSNPDDKAKAVYQKIREEVRSWDISIEMGGHWADSGATDM